MKRLLSILLIAVTLSGCNSGEKSVDKVIALRSNLQRGESCSFDACVSADYGETLSYFELACKLDNQQNWGITVLQPENIAGITCKITAGNGKLTFDDKVVAFELITDDQLTPISAPWLAIKALSGGYISSVTDKESGLLVRLDDSYNDILYSVDLWVNENNLPYFAEIIWQGKRIVSMDINNFQIM